MCDMCDEEVIEAKEIRRMEKIAKEKVEKQFSISVSQTWVAEVIDG